MSATGDRPSDGEGVRPASWAGVAEDGVGVDCVRIARLLARQPARAVGFLWAGDPPGQERDLGPFLDRLALALASFVTGEVAVIGHWRDWGRGPRTQHLAPRVLRVVPPACADGSAASQALQRLLAVVTAKAARVLVDLGGYTASGGVPSAVIAIDGVVVVVGARRARLTRVAALLADVPPGKALGTVLAGGRRRWRLDEQAREGQG